MQLVPPPVVDPLAVLDPANCVCLRGGTVSMGEQPGPRASGKV